MNRRVLRCGVVGQKRHGGAALHIDRACHLDWTRGRGMGEEERVPKWEGWACTPLFFEECASGLESTSCKYSNFGSAQKICFVGDGGRVSEEILGACSNSWGDIKECTMW